jgi:YggT family protein
MIASNSIHALVFLINTLMGLYTAAVMLRFLMQQVRADFYNPLARVVMRLTNPLLLPLRRMIPPWRKIDLAALVAMLVLQLANVEIVLAVAGTPYVTAWGYVLFWALCKLVYILVNLYFFTVLMEAVMSWFGQGRNPMDGVLRPVNAPLLGPARRILPPMEGLDFSPLLVMLALQIIGNYFLPLAWPLAGW